jgi:hypothetical protein
MKRNSLMCWASLRSQWVRLSLSNPFNSRKE